MWIIVLIHEPNQDLRRFSFCTLYRQTLTGVAQLIFQAIDQFVILRDRFLLDLSLGFGYLTPPYDAGGVDAAFVGCVEHCVVLV
jgi:hypothetical protein